MNLMEPAALQRLTRTLAVLDAILCEEDWLRVHRYEPAWSEDLALGIIDNGAGDHLHLLFTPHGTLLKGFDHESPFSPHAQDTYGVWPGIYTKVPAPLLAYLEQDESLEMDHVTFCMWRQPGDGQWRMGNIVRPDGWDDGQALLLGYLCPDPEA